MPSWCWREQGADVCGAAGKAASSCSWPDWCQAAPWWHLQRMLCALGGITQLQPPTHTSSLLASAPSWPPYWGHVHLLFLGSSQLPVGDGCWVRWGSSIASSAAPPSHCCNYQLSSPWLENKTDFLNLGFIPQFPQASSLSNWFSFCRWHGLQWNLSPLIITEEAPKTSATCG